MTLFLLVAAVHAAFVEHHLFTGLIYGIAAYLTYMAVASFLFPDD